MPKNKFKIVDYTGANPVYDRIITVYIPGYTEDGVVDPNSEKQVLCKTAINATIAEELQAEDLYSQAIVHKWNTNSASFKLAAYLINTYNFNIVYEGIDASELVDGKIPQTSWDNLKYSQYNIDYITTGADFAGIDLNGAKCAAYRKDCTYLVDHPNTYSQVVYELYKTEPEDWTTAWVTTYKGNVYTKTEGAYSIVGTLASTPDWRANTYYYLIDPTSDPGDEKYILTTSEPLDWKSNYKYYYTKAADVYNPVNDNEAPTFADNTYYKQVAGVSNYSIYIRGLFESVFVNDGKGIFTEEVLDDKGTKLELNDYAAAFTPWFYSNISTLKESAIPASFGYLFAYGRSVKNNPLWFASAGPERGIIPEFVKPVYKYNILDCEILQARASTGYVELDATGDNVGIAINPIANIRPFDYIIYGNRTLHYNTPTTDGTGKLKASSFLNVKNLVSLFARTAAMAGNKYKFDQNSSLLWAKFASEVTPVLESALQGSGILGYSLTQQPTTRKARLKGKLVIIPIEGYEDLEFTIELTDSLDVTISE